MTDETTATEAETERTAKFSTAFIKKHWLKMIVAAASLGLAVWMASTHQLPPIWPVESSEEYQSQSGFDLASQRWMAISAVAMLFISAGTLILLWRTLTVTSGMLEEAHKTTSHAANTLTASNRSANAAEASVETNKDLARKQAQAYVDLPLLGIEINAHQFSWTIIGVHVYARNVGQTPARNCIIEMEIEVISTDNMPPINDKYMLYEAGLVCIPSKETVDHLALLNAQVIKLNAGFNITISAKITYETVFGEFFSSEHTFHRRVSGMELGDIRTKTPLVDTLKVDPSNFHKPKLFIPSSTPKSPAQ